MILADTSVWIEHLNHGAARMRELLAAGQTAMHPFVLGELALGSMPDWQRVMYRLSRLPAAPKVADAMVLDMISAQRLQGAGIGYVDAHLLGACLLAGETSLWTHDRRLAAVAARLGVDAPAG